jgi:hypothetical protein
MLENSIFYLLQDDYIHTQPILPVALPMVDPLIHCRGTFVDENLHREIGDLSGTAENMWVIVS